MKSKPFFVFKIAVSAALVWLLATKIDFSEFAADFLKINPLYFLGAILAMAAVWLLNSERWRILLDVFSLKDKTRRLFLYVLAGMFYGIVLPGGRVSGDLVRAYQISRDQSGDGQAKRQAFLSVFLDRGIGFAIFAVFAGFYFILGHPASEYLGYQPVFLTFGILAVIFGLGFILTGAFDFLLIYFGRIPVAAARKLSGFILESLKAFRSRGDVQLKAILLSFSSVILSAMPVYLLCQGLGIAINYWTVALFVSLSAILTVIPITVAGIGLREGGLAYLLVQSGVIGEKAAAAALLHLGVIVFLSLFGGLVELRYHFLKSKPVSNE